MQWSRTGRRWVGGFSLGLLLCGCTAARAATIRSVTIGDLFAQADQVVLVRIVAGDTEHYGTVVYKAVVETAYKGAKANEVVYLGPYAGLGIGAEYVVFLQAGDGVKPKDAGGLAFGEVKELGKIMSAGYAALPVGYECVFDESSVVRRCDDSVELNPEQIVLPKTIRTYPRHEAGAVASYKVWVRRSDFLPRLQMLSEREAGKSGSVGR
jgi:hypothetical protein